MQRFFHVRTLFILLIGASFFTSCGVDENPIPLPTGTAPSISLLTETGYISSDATISAGQTILVKIDAAKGENQMNTLVIQRDGVDIDLSEISYNGAPAPANPTLLFGTDKDAFTYDAEITSHTSGDALYTFIVTGDGDNTENSVSVIISIEDAAPELTVNGTGMFDAFTGSSAGFTINGVTNGVDFSTLAVYQDGVLIEGDRISCNGVFAATNPFNLEGSDTTGFTDKSITVRTTTTVGVQNYTIEVTNVNGGTASADFTINAMTTGTPIGATFTGVLLENASGPNATGGIDLANGLTVSVNDPLATLIDLGNNSAGTAWQERIAGANGGTLKAISAAQIDNGFSLGGLTLSEEIETAYVNGISLTDNESGIVEIGDYFFANANGIYFALEVKEKGVNTAGLGFYRFDIVKTDF